MQTAKPKSKRGKIIAVIVILAVLVGGVASYFIFFQSTGGGGTSGFALNVYTGDPNNRNSWAKISPALPGIPPATLLNGTSLSLVVEATATGTFGDFVQLSFSKPVGVTYSFARTTLRPLGSGNSFTGLTLTAPANIPTRGPPYNFTVTGTSGSTSHNATFPLLLRATTVSLTPSSVRVLVGNATSVFTARIGISDMYDVSGFQVYVGFNSSVVKAVNATFASVFTNPFTGYTVPLAIDNVAGQITLGGAVLFSPCGVAACLNSPAPQVFNVANVTFINSTFTGSTSLRLTNVVLTELFPINPNPFPVVQLNVLGGSATVYQRLTSTSLACSPNSTPIKTGSTCTATVTDTTLGTFITPTGMVNFTITNTTGTFPLGSSALTGSSASSTCSVTFTQNIPETVFITATYEGDRPHSTSSSSQYAVTFTP